MDQQAVIILDSSDEEVCYFLLIIYHTKRKLKHNYVLSLIRRCVSRLTIYLFNKHNRNISLLI